MVYTHMQAHTYTHTTPPLPTFLLPYTLASTNSSAGPNQNRNIHPTWSECCDTRNSQHLYGQYGNSQNSHSQIPKTHIVNLEILKTYIVNFGNFQNSYSDVENSQNSHSQFGNSQNSFSQFWKFSKLIYDNFRLVPNGSKFWIFFNSSEKS